MHADVNGSVDAVILAGGSGQRMCGSLPKQLLEIIPGRTVLDLSLSMYQEIDEINSIIVVANADYMERIKKIGARYGKVGQYVSGGMTRQESAMSGVKASAAEYLLIHDAARPFVSRPAVGLCLEKLFGGDLCVNTIMQPPATMVVLHDSRMVSTMDGRTIALGQCPQGFKRKSLLQAYDIVKKTKETFSDDCSVMLAAHLMEAVPTVQGDLSGFKLTYPQDIDILKLFLTSKDPTFLSQSILELL